MTAAIRQWYRLAAAIIIANTALILRFIFAHNRNCRYLFYRTARRAHGAVNYRGNDGGGNVVIYRRAAMQVINRRHLFYRGAPCARRG